MKKIKIERNPKWSLEIECPYCHTRLLIETLDIYYTRLEYSWGTRAKSEVNCMSCHTSIEIFDKDLPPEILQHKKDLIKSHGFDEPSGN
jgi:hypothetical protein